MRGRAHDILKIGLNADPEYLKIDRITSRIAEALPLVKIRYVKSDTINTPRMLKEKTIDMGFVFGADNTPEMRVYPLTHVDMKVVIPKQLSTQPWALDWEDIVLLPWIWVDKTVACHAAFQRRLDQRHLSLNTVTYTCDDSITMQLIKSGRGLALMRHDEAEKLAEEGHALIWEKGAVSVPLGLACLPEHDEASLAGRAREAIAGLWP